jgi:Tfp pilus assembly PilM family ATPase
VTHVGSVQLKAMVAAARIVLAGCGQHLGGLNNDLDNAFEFECGIGKPARQVDKDFTVIRQLLTLADFDR